MKIVPSSLSNLKSKIDKLDVHKLLLVPVDSSKLINLVKNDFVKKDVYNNANKKNIEDKISDITNVATNTSLNAKINEVKGEILSITNLATITALNATINEVKNKITNFINLATTTALTTVENKMPNSQKLTIIQKLVKLKKKITTDHDHDKYIATQQFNKLTSGKFTERLAQANLARKVTLLIS